ncbi:M48 family metalloprotease [Brevundimonas sp.]|uniref:M48 family metalloprotease n=1 Tax=Brevundimonas sp. TaxID=1871086 RepID=UPI003AF5A488
MRSLPLVITLTCLVLTGCKSDGPLRPDAYGTGAEVETPSDRLTTLNALDARVNAVGFRLSVANAELCPRTGPITGLLLHAESQYADYLREAARENWKLRGDLPGVAAIAPDSPAARAGLRTGDLLLSADGQPFQDGGPVGDAGFDGLSRNLAVLAEALDDGSAELVVERDGQRLTLRLGSVAGCAYPFQLDPSADFYARGDGERVFISSALAALSPLDDDLAVVLGHELAHNILDHRAYFDEVGLARDVLGNWGVAPWELVRAEREADRVGLFLSARAGYDPARAGPYWRMLSGRLPHLRMVQWGHPSAGERIRSLERVAEEIAVLRAAGQPLIP